MAYRSYNAWKDYKQWRREQWDEVALAFTEPERCQLWPRWFVLVCAVQTVLTLLWVPWNALQYKGTYEIRGQWYWSVRF